MSSCFLLKFIDSNTSLSINEQLLSWLITSLKLPLPKIRYSFNKYFTFASSKPLSILSISILSNSLTNLLYSIFEHVNWYFGKLIFNFTLYFFS